jgi:hypothetical protein
MLVLPEAGLVLLENPKTATMSIRAMLGAAAVVEVPRHANARLYAAEAAGLAARFGRSFRTVAVVREPLARLQSWHRYRQRAKVADGPRSAAGISFEAFVCATLDDRPPPYARVGRQDRFVGWNGRAAAVDHLFDFERLDLLVDVLSGRLGRPLRLPHRNASPPAAPAKPLSEEVLALLIRARADEFALYRAVAAAGVLTRAGAPGP